MLSVTGESAPWVVRPLSHQHIEGVVVLQALDSRAHREIAVPLARITSATLLPETAHSLGRNQPCPLRQRPKVQALLLTALPAQRLRPRRAFRGRRPLKERALAEPMAMSLTAPYGVGPPRSGVVEDKTPDTNAIAYVRALLSAGYGPTLAVKASPRAAKAAVGGQAHREGHQIWHRGAPRTPSKPDVPVTTPQFRSGVAHRPDAPRSHRDSCMAHVMMIARDVSEETSTDGPLTIGECAGYPQPFPPRDASIREGFRPFTHRVLDWTSPRRRPRAVMPMRKLDRTPRWWPWGKRSAVQRRRCGRSQVSAGAGSALRTGCRWRSSELLLTETRPFTALLGLLAAPASAEVYADLDMHVHVSNS